MKRLARTFAFPSTFAFTFFFAFGLQLPLAAGPIEELYPNHLTFHLDFDDGTVVPSVGGLKPQNGCKFKIDEGGLFGSKGFTCGGFTYTMPKGQKVFNTKRPGTLVFWLKLAQPVEPKGVYEPGATFFSANWTPTHRIIVFRQGNLGWGEAGTDLMYEAFAPDGKHLSSRVGSGARSSLRDWKVGEWHMVAFQWSPDSFAGSFDGGKFRKIMSAAELGPFAGWMGFGLGEWQKTGRSLFVLDEASILDFGMSDDQVSELHREYRAMMEEVSVPDAKAEVAIEKMGRGRNAGLYEIALRVKNAGAAKADFVCDLVARPESSQPTKKRETLALAPGETKVVSADGPIQGDEKVAVDLRVTTADGRILFNRRRTFAPNAEEPEWMRAPSSVAFKFAYYPYENTVHAFADVTGCDDFQKIGRFVLAIRKKGGDGVVATKEFPAAANGKNEIFWRGIPELDGEYVCTLTGVGLDGVKAEQAFLRKRFPWEHNKLGLSGKVPAPFERVRREKVGGESRSTVELEKVSVVLREHIVDKKTELWQQVVAQGKELLARPMRLVEIKKVGGESRSTEDGKFHCSPSPSTFTFSSLWDVDGMMVWKLTLQPGHYEPMSLEIPVRGERARLWHACTDGIRFNRAGALPSGTGPIWASTNLPNRAIVGPYAPYLWVGGPLRGIAVFGENDKGWVLGREQKVGGESRSTEEGKVPLSTSTSSLLSCSCPCQEVIREADGTVVIRLNLIQCAVDLTEARTIKIGFQATPVKPMLENWRSMGHGSLLGACYYWGGYWDSHAIEPFDGTDEFFRVMGESRRTGVFNEEYAKRAIESYPYPYPKGSPEYADQYRRITAHYRSGLSSASLSKREPCEFVAYTNGRGVHYGDRKGQGATFCNEWCRLEYLHRAFTIKSMAAYDMDPVLSYRDYAAWWWERMLSTGAIDHMYWDNVFCQSSFNLVQTDAYRLPTGQIQPSSGIFNMREQVKRCAVLEAELGKDPRGNWVHMTNTAMAPVLAFAGVNYDWEDSSGQQPHQVKYPKDYILATTIGRQFGNRVGIMGYFDFSLDKKGEKYKWLCRTGAGVMLTHELRWGQPEYAKWHKFLCDWGYRTPAVDVWNYWDEDVAYPLAVSGVENASIVMAKKSASEAYVCVSSFSAEDGAVTVTPDAATLGLSPGWKATDAETGKEIPVADGTFRLDIPKYDWRLVRLN